MEVELAQLAAHINTTKTRLNWLSNYHEMYVLNLSLLNEGLGSMSRPFICFTQHLVNMGPFVFYVCYTEVSPLRPQKVHRCELHLSLKIVVEEFGFFFNIKIYILLFNLYTLKFKKINYQ